MSLQALESRIVFQSTLPAKGATTGFPFIRTFFVISIHAPREGSDRRLKELQEQADISIHAPREGSDAYKGWIPRQGRISIHAPREGSDMRRRLRKRRHNHFNPRSPRRERLSSMMVLWKITNFNPRSPRRERPLNEIKEQQCSTISIHAPREGSDLRSRPSETQRRISIHAPREGSDSPVCCTAQNTVYFNPRSPRRERPPRCIQPRRVSAVFQSTLPAKGATEPPQNNFRLSKFQSTLPAKGATF